MGEVYRATGLHLGCTVALKLLPEHFDFVAPDPMLANLHRDRRFDALLQRMKQDVDRMRRHSSELKYLVEKTPPSLPPPASADRSDAGVPGVAALLDKALEAVSDPEARDV